MGGLTLKFAVFTDIHYDVIHDANRRLHEFINIIKKKNVDFIVELGDLCRPVEENTHIIDKLKEFVPCYCTIGNHDGDIYPLDKVLKFLHLKKSYYSFAVDNIKFIVLDANFIRTQDGVTPFCSNYHSNILKDYPYVPQEEIMWLKQELENDQYYYVIFSHHSLSNDFKKRGISNRAEIRAILEQRNCVEKKVLLCMNGHDHGDDLKVVNGIPYYTVNSMSYIWYGVKETYNYSSEIHERYPHMKDMILYEEPLHVIVNIDDNMTITMEGVEGHYQNILPKEIGLGNTWNAVSVEPRTSTVMIKR